MGAQRMGEIGAPAAAYADLSAKVVYISGGASGIGEAFVEEFCAQGSAIFFTDIDGASGRALADRISKACRDVVFCESDVTDDQAVREAVRLCASRLGAPDVLINNAASDARHAFADVTADFWDKCISVNLKHQFFTTQAVAPFMIEKARGSIINMGSISWRIGAMGMPCYTTAKAAIHGLTKSLARELGVHNIRVNTLLPGWIMTDRQIRLWLDEDGEKEMMTRQALKRALVPAEVAHMAAFLASDVSSACTSQEFVVDGGWT